MNTFVNSLKNGSAPDTQTTNGMGAHSNTGSVLVDLFSMVGASRDSVRAVIDAFERALNVDKNIAAKILLWARDVREGAGERMIPREMLKFLENRDPELVLRLLPKLPELGRFDDLLIFGNPKVKKAAMSLFSGALLSYGKAVRILRDIDSFTEDECRSILRDLDNDSYGFCESIQN